ncbi:hypothetical protein NST48_18325 [Paenibacillus sp. FSL M7-0547]|jgi:hypothetical protein|uniref:hypothetical protein n=2 Tax=Paenibacillus TaxID=44249 RepID=UPI0004F8D7FC|nr:hypothetical protein [Paenibacillus odorifer]AIQ74867.1 hypothetical protein PODO_17265 [Paenibacillus odorifer]
MERSMGGLDSRAFLRLDEADVWVKLAFVNFERREFISESILSQLVCVYLIWLSLHFVQQNTS